MPADPSVIERVLASSGVERVPVPPESSYLGELLGTAANYVVRALMAGAQKLRIPPGLLWVIAAGLAVLLALLVARLVLSRLRRRRRSGEAEGEALAARPAPAVPRDAAAWRAELERRLAGGQVPEALEALWWWLARALTGGEAEADWTSRDLVTRSGREDLRDLARRLDAFTYGPRPPEIGELRGLLGRFEEALA